MGRLSGLSLWAQYNHHTSCKRDAEVLSIRREGRMMAEAALKLCALEMEQESRQPPEDDKHKETDSPSEPPEGTRPANTLTLAK